MGAVSLGYTGYLKSLEYARERPQGRPVSAKDPSTPQIPIIEHADVKRMLLAQKTYVEGGMALLLYCAKLVDLAHSAESDKEKDSLGLLLDILTPIGKSWPSQWCLEANDLAIQVHGGYGYTKEFDVEQCYRDNRLNAIHEGTHGIHGLDLLGRKVVMQDGAGLTLLTERINQTIDKALESDSTAAYAKGLREALQRLVDVTATLWSVGDVATTLANSTIYLEAAGHVVMAWMWLEQLIAASDHQGDFYDGKRAAAQYFYAYELPKVGPQFDLLASLDRTTVDAQASWF
jgi:butyryl-CoA dehydrogenase